MSSPHRKYYVVWVGQHPGVYDNWEDCQEQITNYPMARYKSFPNKEAAVAAYRGNPAEYIGIFKEMAKRPEAATLSLDPHPEVRQDAIAVDGACAKNPGPMEYRCVRVSDGQEIFHLGPLDDGTNNVAEYLALVHALAMLDKQGDHLTPIYSDSVNAISWIRKRGHRSKLAVTPRNARIHELLARADAWLQAHEVLNPILKWNTPQWGEIPADFGRK